MDENHLIVAEYVEIGCRRHNSIVAPDQLFVGGCILSRQDAHYADAEVGNFEVVHRTPIRYRVGLVY
jgi:hypothetical protein